MKLPSGSDFSLELDLAHDIVPAQCKTRLLSTKVNTMGGSRKFRKRRPSPPTPPPPPPP